MNPELTQTALYLGEELINLSNSFAAELKKWSDIPERPNGLKASECVGFMSDEQQSKSGVTFVIDVQAPEGALYATLRIWTIKIVKDDTGLERYHNIQMNFKVDHAKAVQVTQKGGEADRADLLGLLKATGTSLEHMRVSYYSGFDEKSQLSVGSQYDISALESDKQQDYALEIVDVAMTVLGLLQKSA